jgi:hypothetical protein
MSEPSGGVRFEDAVRAAVGDLADEGRPVDLAGPALRQGQRMRSQRTAFGSLAATLVAVLVLAAGLALTRGAGGGTGPAAGRSTPSARPLPSDTMAGPVTLPGGWIVGSVPQDQERTWVYSRLQHRYRLLPYRAAPAPAGNLVAIENDNRLGLLDLATDSVRWVDDRGTYVWGRLAASSWSPDGTHLAYAYAEHPPDAAISQIVVVDVATATARVLGQGAPCANTCHPTWVDDDTVGLDLPAANPQGVAAFSAGTGAARGTITLPGYTTPTRPWSADGRHVAVLVTPDALTGPLPLGIVDRTTGTLIATLTDIGNPYWATDDTLMVVTAGGVAVVGLDGRRVDFVARPDRFAGMQWAYASLVHA